MIMESQQLFCSRPQTVRKQIREIADKDVACDFHPSIVSGGKVLGAYSGPRSSDLPRKWRFRTSVAGIFANYSESWTPTDSTAANYRLVSFALTLFGTSDELFAVHAEPFNTEQNPKRLYKAGPHVHLIGAADPIPHMHIPLCLREVDLGIDSLAKFDEMRVLACRVLREDVLPQFA